jgi:alginate production protein
MRSLTAAIAALAAACLRPQPGGQRAGVAALAITGSLPLAAQNIDYAVRTTVAVEADGRRDLGLAGGGTDNDAFLNIAPRAIVEFSPAWTGYVRARVFIPTGRIAPFDSNEPDDSRPARAYGGINELWIQYGGFTSYPGEAVRLGRQHIRQTDSGWWDQDADALRWMLDTTLVDAEIGVAHPFSAFRTDGADIPVAQRDRTYFFAQIAADWRAENRVGLRAVHSSGGGTGSASGGNVGPAPLEDSRLTWLGVYAENGFYDILGAHHALSYATEITYLKGEQRQLATGAWQDVAAWEATAQLRWRPFKHWPLQIGAAYAYSQGGESAGRSHQFQQTGMQSNSSYFTGTKTLVGRYNETLQAELGNLRVTTAFLSADFDSNDASLIFSRFRRDDGFAPITTNTVTALPVNESRDLGDGIDLVFTHYFSREQRRQRLLDRGDAFTALRRRSLASLRASAFRPGDAYGATARTSYRVLLEGTIWLD